MDFVNEKAMPVEPDGEQAYSRALGKYMALVPPSFFLVLASILFPGGLQATYQSTSVLLVLNSLFLTAVPLIACYFAARGFVASGSPSMLLLGCGLLTMGASSFVGGWIVSGEGGVNDTITVYNTGFLLASAFHLAGSMIILTGGRGGKIAGVGRKWRLALAYCVVGVLICSISFLAIKNVTPVLFIQGEGPSLLRQVILSLAVTLFLGSSCILMLVHVRTRTEFVYWYSLSLLLIAEGLGILLFQRALGSPINWMGRGFQYLGGIYFLIAVMKAFREAHARGIPLERAFHALVDIEELQRAESALKESEEKIRRQLSEIEAIYKSNPIGMGVFDRDLRYLRVNDRLAEINGIPAEDHIGRTVREIVPDLADQAEETAERILRTGEAQLNIEFSGTTRCRPGVVRFFVEQWLPLKDAGGAVIGINVVVEDITERKRLEEELRRSEAFERARSSELAALIEAIPSPVWISHDPECRTVTGNAAAHEILGAGKEAVNLSGSAPPGEGVYYEVWRGGVRIAPEQMTMQQATAAGGPILRDELKIVRSDGSERWIYGNAVPLKDDQGRVRGCVCACVDITERKLAEEALRQAVQRYEQQVRLFDGVASTTPDFVYIFDLQGQFLYANRRLLEVWGMELPDVIGKTCRDLGYEQWHHDRHMREISQVIETKRPIKGEVPFKAPLTGIYGIYEYIFTPVLGLDGEVDLIAGTTRDVTERKEMEDELRNAKEEAIQRALELDAAINSIADGVLIYDREGNLIRVNATAQHLLGYNPEEMRRPLRDRTERLCVRDLAGREVSSDELLITRALQGETVMGQQLLLTTPRGKTRCLSFSAAPIRSRGEFLGVIATFTDLTSQRELTEELRRAKDELELRVQERTGELRRSNSALTEYAARLERLNEELEDFAFVAAHDLQEPLRKIQTFGSILMSRCRDSLTDQGKDYLLRMTRSAERMSDLVRSLRDYSQATSRKKPFVRTDLRQVVEEVLSDLEVVLTHSGAEVEVGDLPAIEASAPQLRHLFQNLIGNAIKYRKERGKPLIRISGSIEGGTCQILVEDNGIGFERSYVDRIFRPFQRLHDRDASYEGTGMGLATCRRIVERHGGSITAESTPGRGATFIVRVPVKQALQDSLRAGKE